MVVLDCAPTAESMRFISMPATLEWYMKHVFPMQRGLIKAFWPIAPNTCPRWRCRRIVTSPNVQELFSKLDGVGEVLEDPQVTSVLLVTNAEKMVLRETERAYVYFSLHGLTVDQIIVNRVIPAEVTDEFFRDWRASQQRILEEIDAYFAPVPVKRVPLFAQEVLGAARLETLANAIYEGGPDPAEVTRTADFRTWGLAISVRKREAHRTGQCVAALHASQTEAARPGMGNVPGNAADVRQALEAGGSGCSHSICADGQHGGRERK